MDSYNNHVPQAEISWRDLADVLRGRLSTEEEAMFKRLAGQYDDNLRQLGLAMEKSRSAFFKISTSGECVLSGAAAGILGLQGNVSMEELGVAIHPCDRPGFMACLGSEVAAGIEFRLESGNGERIIRLEMIPAPLEQLCFIQDISGFREKESLLDFRQRVSVAANSAMSMDQLSLQMLELGLSIKGIDFGVVLGLDHESQSFVPLTVLGIAAAVVSIPAGIIRSLTSDMTEPCCLTRSEALGLNLDFPGFDFSRVGLYPANPENLVIYGSTSLESVPASSRAMLAETASGIASAIARIAAGNALRASEENYRLLVENQSDMIIKVGINGRIIFASRGCATRLASASTDIRGKQFLRFIDKSLRHQLIDKIRGVKKRPFRFSFEQQLGAEGKNRCISWRCNAIFNPGDNKVSAFIGIGRDVTEQKYAEALLRHSEERLRLILKAVSDSIWDWNLQDDSFTFDGKLYSILGYAPDEINIKIYDLIRNFVHIEDRQRVEQEMRSLVEEHSSTFDCSFRLRRKNGEYIWVLMRAVVVKENGQHPTRMVGCLEDISARKDFDRLKEQYGILQKILDAIPIPVFYKDMNGRYLGFNRCAYASMTSLGQQIGVGNTAADLFPQGDRDGTLAKILEEERKLINEGGHSSFSIRYITANGDQRDAVFHKSLVRSADGKPEFIVGAIIDVSDLKNTEHALKLASQRLNTILNVMHEIIIWFDEELKAVWGNRTAYARLGGKLENITGRSCDELWFGHESGSDSFREAMEGGRQIIRLDDGSIYETWFYPVKSGANGGGGGWVQLALDVTRQEKAREEARVRQEQLIQADKLTSLGILVSGVAHEINNPNNFIVINVSILKKAWDNIMTLLNEYAELRGEFTVAGVSYEKFSNMVSDLLDGIEEGADRIRLIVNDLKDYVRQTPADLKGRFNVNDALSRAFTLCRNMLKRSSNNYNILYGEALPMVKGDVYRIEQVIINIIQNACDSLPNKDAAITVKTYISNESAREVVIEVADEGMGIPKEQLKHISDPFYTTKREAGGTGLGLSISTAIVEEHNGRLLIDSAMNKGTVVKICLPALCDSMQDKATPR